MANRFEPTSIEDGFHEDIEEEVHNPKTKDIIKEIRRADAIKQVEEEQVNRRLVQKCRECLVYRIGAMILGGLGIICISVLTYIVEAKLQKDGLILGAAGSTIIGIIAYVFGRKGGLKELHK